MEEGPKTFTPKESESIKEKRERLMPIFQESFDIFRNPDRDLWKGVLTISCRRPHGIVESVSNLVCVGINKGGPELAWVDDEGKLTASATMGWEEIVDARI